MTFCIMDVVECIETSISTLGQHRWIKIQRENHMLLQKRSLQSVYEQETNFRLKYKNLMLLNVPPNPEIEET